MWHYAQRISPRFIHTFNSAAIGIGRNYRDRFSRDGHHVAWFHDFPEYTPGHQFVDDRQSLSQPDQEWREVVVGHEAAHAPHSDASFTVSGEIAEMLARDYALPVPPQVLLNVPRLSDFDPKYEPTVRQTLRLLPEVPLFVYSGGVTALRGIETLISALGRFPSAHLAIVTNTKSAHLASLIDLARRQGIVSRLHLLPYVAPARISSFLRDATAGVHPLTHYGNGEVALPNKLFDYLHAGLPVVVSDVRAMRNIVSGRRLGVVFTAGDPAELAKALKAVTDDRNTIKDNIANNRPFLHECAWETQERRLLDVYEKWEKPSQI
jgi:glycosyltransferase involved in cell wall biosynthesis